MTVPYGSWRSPISAELLAGGGVLLEELHAGGGALYWAEGRPAEGGRGVVCRWTPGAGTESLTPPEFDVRTRVHEYGGGAFLPGDQGTVYFSNLPDQRLWRQDDGAAPRPLTPPPPGPAALRYADSRLLPDSQGTTAPLLEPPGPPVGRGATAPLLEPPGPPGADVLACVHESHLGGQVTNQLVAVPADGGEPRVLATGRDFYAAPRPSPDGRRLAWLEWDHPRMPWDGTELYVADLAGGTLAGPARLVAGGAEESIFCPAWSPDGTLHFVSDRTGWWNLYREEADGAVRPLAPGQAEFGEAQWTFGMSTYAVLPDGRIACLYGRGPVRHLGLVTPGADRPVPVELPFTDFSPPQLCAFGERLALIAGSSRRPAAIVLIDPDTAEVEVVRSSRELDLDPRYLSIPRPLEFPTGDGETAHALYYPPANPDAEAPPGERPPLVVTCHGGPTASVVDRLKLGVQYLTSRGIAVADVDYRGSTGYGRAYREALKGRWGEADTEDCVNVARHLATVGEVDGDRLAISGGSAGGYAVLCALAFHDLFAAGVSEAGLADLVSFVGETHKFEARYLDQLIGPWPQAAELYRQRSPLYAADRINCPVILIQGLDDAVVPASQAEVMVRALAERGIPYAYLTFPGERHGLRKAENIERAVEGELYFLGRILGFELADKVEPVPIAGLDDAGGTPGPG
jgi:dipeptidyl aminopeptidase/acylaminoacyl peptidase